MFLYPLILFFVGLVAGLVGIGGGMFNSPLFLSFGMFPDVAIATSATTVFITSLSASLNFIVLDQLLLDYGIWYFSIGIFGALIGTIVLQPMLKKYDSIWIIGFVIALLVCIGTILMIILSIITLQNDIITNSNLTFRSFCNSLH